MKSMFVYILKCSDNSYYTGVTNDIDKRLAEHSEGIDNNSYTYLRRPLELVYSEFFTDANLAIAREKQLKGWSRKKKQALIDNNLYELIKLSKSKM